MKFIVTSDSENNLRITPGTHLIRGGDRARGQVQEPRASTILESHGEPIHHDFLVAVGCLNAQLVELQELCRVGGAVVARRQVWLELAWPDDATQLRSEGAAACCGHRGPLQRRSVGSKVCLEGG